MLICDIIHTNVHNTTTQLIYCISYVNFCYHMYQGTLHEHLDNVWINYVNLCHQPCVRITSCYITTWSGWIIDAFYNINRGMLVELTLPTLPYLEVHYVTRSTTTRVLQPESDCGWANGWHVHSEMLVS